MVAALASVVKRKWRGNAVVPRCPFANDKPVSTNVLRQSLYVTVRQNPWLLSPHSKKRIRDPSLVFLPGGVMDVLYQEVHSIIFEQYLHAPDPIHPCVTQPTHLCHVL